MASISLPMPRDWYEASLDQGSGTHNEFDVYEAAKAKLLSELSPKEYERVIYESATSVDSFASLLKEMKGKYDVQSTDKAGKWLQIFAGKVVYYGTVLDVLVQQYPQYVSLAWGAMKFLFMSVINHEEMTKELAKAYSMIADLLPRTDFTLIHYPTAAMRECITQLYAHIILFTSRAIRWYKKGKFSHAVSAVARPWSLNWKDSVAAITEQSRRVESLARVAAQAELRDTRLEVKVLRSEVQTLSSASTTAYSSMMFLLEKLSLNGEQVYELTNKTQDLVQDIKPMLQTQKTETTVVFLSTVVALPWAKEVPSAESTLRFCASMRRRRRAPSLQLPGLETMSNWATSKQSTLLFISSKSIQASKDLTIDLARLLSSSKAPTLWVFRYSKYWEGRPTFTTILKSLNLQALNLFPNCLTSGPNPISSSHLLEASNEADWLNILKRACSGIESIYILLDAEMVAMAGDHNKFRITRWLERFISELGSLTKVKIFVSGTILDRSYISRTWEDGSWSELITDRVDGGIKSAKSRKLLQHQTAQRRKRL